MILGFVVIHPCFFPDSKYNNPGFTIQKLHLWQKTANSFRFPSLRGARAQLQLSGNYALARRGRCGFLFNPWFLITLWETYAYKSVRWDISLDYSFISINNLTLTN